MTDMTRCLRRVWSGLLALGLAAFVQAQTSAPAGTPAQAVRPIGVVTAIDTTAKRLTLKTDVGLELTVELQAATTFVRVPPGEKDLKNATKTALSDVVVGDRVLVRGKIAEDQKSIPATAVIVMTKADITKKQAADRAEWQRRGVSGTITALNPSSREVKISMRTPEGRKPLIVTMATNAELRRYAPDSVKFSDAKPSTFDALKIGDEVRALGSKSEDNARYTAEELVSGTFRNIAGLVLTISPTENVVRMTDLETKKPLLVEINGDSTLRRLSPIVAQMIAMRLRGSGMGSGRPGGPNGPGPAGVISAAGPGGRGPGGEAAGFGPGGGMRGQSGPVDMQQILERMPAVALSELKAGDAIIVASTVGADPGKVMAITLLAGVEPLLTAAPDGGQQMNLGTWNFEMNMNIP